MTPLTIAGGSDVSLVVPLITDAAVCADCIAKRTGIVITAVERLVDTLAGTVRVTFAAGRCVICLEPKMTMTLARAATQPGALPDLLWHFLEHHRGAWFCSACLSSVLHVGRRIDRALMMAEARGAQRHYGVCSMCGKGRLVCRLAPPPDA